MTAEGTRGTGSGDVGVYVFGGFPEGKHVLFVECFGRRSGVAGEEADERIKILIVDSGFVTEVVLWKV